MTIYFHAIDEINILIRNVDTAIVARGLTLKQNVNKYYLVASHVYSLHLLLNWKLCAVKCTHIPKGAIQLRIIDTGPDMGRLISKLESSQWTFTEKL